MFIFFSDLAWRIPAMIAFTLATALTWRDIRHDCFCLTLLPPNTSVLYLAFRHRINHCPIKLPCS
jgi:hypothetical protein